jgi:Heparinase II/III-like protein
MFKPLCHLLTLCIISTSIHAQVTPRNILEKTYRPEAVSNFLVPKDQWKPYPQTPEAWEKAVPQTNRLNIIQEAENLLKFRFEPISGTISMDFKRSGDRLRHSNISFKKREVLMYLIMAESMEGKGRFTEAIFNGIWSICEESYWGVPAHIGGTGLPDVERPVVDLFSAETAAVVALADYFVGDRMDSINPLIRKRIYHETDRRLFTPMLQYGDKYGWMSRTKPVNNWNPWIMSNWILSSLLLEKNKIRRDLMVYKSMVGLDAYLNSLGDDGGCDEGPSYWFAAGASVFDCLDLLHNASEGKINVYDNELIRKMAGYITKTHIDGNYFVNFADADPTLTPSGLLLYRFGTAVKDQSMIEFGKWAQQKFPTKGGGATGMRMRYLENMLTLQNMDTSAAKFNDPEAAWIGDIQILTARTPSGLFMATHGGHNAESHNHNDVGDFIIYLKGEPMIIDAGRGNYTARTFSNRRYELWFTQSEYHNLPIINGKGQVAGRNFEAKDVKEIINSKETSLSMDISTAYPEATGLTSMKRTVKLNREKERVEVKDVYELKNTPLSFEQVFMTICEVNTEKLGKLILKGKDDRSLILDYDPKSWTVKTEEPSFEGMEYESFNKKWGGKKITRIILTNIKPKIKGNHQFIFTPKTTLSSQ